MEERQRPGDSMKVRTCTMSDSADVRRHSDEAVACDMGDLHAMFFCLASHHAVPSTKALDATQKPSGA